MRRLIGLGLVALGLAILLAGLLGAQPPRFYFLVTYTGTGTEGDSFRPNGMRLPSFLGHIDLRPDRTVATGRALAVFSADVAGSGRFLLGSNLDGLDAGAKAEIEARLGATLQATTVRGLVTEILTQYCREDGTRVRCLRPTRQGFYEIHLGGRVFQQRQASWWRLGLGTRLWSALFVPRTAWAATATEDWNCGNSTTITCDLTWTEYSNADMSIISSALSAGSLAVTEAYESADSTTNNVRVSVTATTWTFGGGAQALFGGPICRKAASATRTFYSWIAYRDSTPDNSHYLESVVAGATSTLANPATDQTTGALTLVCDGSSISGQLDAAVIAGPVTDTAIDGTTVGGKRAGMRAKANTGDSAQYVFDNFAFSDIAPVGDSGEPWLGFGGGIIE